MGNGLNLLLSMTDFKKHSLIKTLAEDKQITQLQMCGLHGLSLTNNTFPNPPLVIELFEKLLTEIHIFFTSFFETSCFNNGREGVAFNFV